MHASPTHLRLVSPSISCFVSCVVSVVIYYVSDLTFFVCACVRACVRACMCTIFISNVDYNECVPAALLKVLSTCKQYILRV